MSEDKIIQIISQSLGVEPEELKPELELETDLRVQHLEIADMLLNLEKEFSVKIPEEEKGDIRTVQDVIDAVLDNLP